MNNIKMLCFSRIGVSEGIDVNKTSKSKEWDICHYWYFVVLYQCCIITGISKSETIKLL